MAYSLSCSSANLTQRRTRCGLGRSGHVIGQASNINCPPSSSSRLSQRRLAGNLAMLASRHCQDSRHSTSRSNMRHARICSTLPALHFVPAAKEFVAGSIKAEKLDYLFLKKIHFLFFLRITVVSFELAARSRWLVAHPKTTKQRRGRKQGFVMLSRLSLIQKR